MLISEYSNWPLSLKKKGVEIAVILKTLTRMVVHKVANGPELRARISSTVQQEIVPRAEQGWK